MNYYVVCSTDYAFAFRIATTHRIGQYIIILIAMITSNCTSYLQLKLTKTQMRRSLKQYHTSAVCSHGGRRGRIIPRHLVLRRCSNSDVMEYCFINHFRFQFDDSARRSGDGYEGVGRKKCMVQRYIDFTMLVVGP